ncbi:InlB B-repeat-containing protein [Clostridium sp. Marseille-P299]|uniref:InlB B-repeat-containing protein n=1 Tax=Clostridium sp. Marseille-P299 TaxID=1805477 RepID=UPI0008366937|nr:InlB B-repeat-containing protein [Clostridium sp. Marseille-P299]
MFGLKKKCLMLILGMVTLLTVGCSVGTKSLFVHPTEQGYPYAVTYDALGGHINQMKTRVVYYAEDSLLYKPSGTSGMLVEPKNGQKTLIGWYTNYTTEETKNGTVYNFNEDDLWNFDTDRVNATVAPEETLEIYARWADNPNILFVDADNPDGDSLLKWNINVGNTLSRPTSAEPTKSGYTLVDYYADEACSTKYTFGQIISEENIEYDENGNAYIKIYCKFIEGELIRVKTISQLQAMEQAPEAKYILANDLDLSGQAWKPIEGFTGEFDGNGYTISNLTVNAKNKVAGVAAKNADEVSFGLFATLNNAKISDLTLKDTKIIIDKTSNVKLCAGVLAGRTKRATIKNVMVDGAVIEATGPLTIDVVVSPLVVGDLSTKLENITLNNYLSPSIETKGLFEEWQAN